MSCSAEIRKIVIESARKAYKPVIGELNYNESLIESKFGGKPFISEPKYPWPMCECGNKMQFFLQLNSNSFPSKLEIKEKYFNGLLQLFYCDCSDGWKPFADCHVVRVVDSVDLNNNSESLDTVKDVDLFPLKRIVDWDEKVDYISSSELAEREEIAVDDYDELEDIHE